MPGPSVYVRGSGVVTVLGRGAAAHARALAAGQPGPSTVPPGPRIPPWPYHCVFSAEGHERLHQMLDEAVTDALAEAALPDAAREKMAVLVGSTCLDLPLHESRYVESLGSESVPVAIKGPGYGNVANDVARRFGLRGPQYTINTACSSSANALLHARLLLLEGRVEHALVVGAEAYNRLSVLGFASLLLLSRTRYRPFDCDRDGLILGEGAGAMVLSARSPSHVARPLALRGAATACDPSSPTNARPERVADVMRAALADAGVAPGDLVAIKAHGTGTPSNDGSEGLAMRALPGRLPPFTSIKPYFGHTLGGCGVIELAALLAAWREGFLPGTPGFAETDPALGLRPATEKIPLGPGPLLCNYFGFGGNNTSLVVSLP